MGFRGVLFDAGDTLIRPIGGRWNPRYDFEQVLLRHHPEVRVRDFPAAFAAGQRLLDTALTTPERSAYHRAILAALGIDQPAPSLLAELEQPVPGPVVEPFPEVRAVLERLHALGVGMAVVSDTWAGVAGMFDELGLGRYFEVCVVSAEMGCNKPDPRMYRAGSQGLGLPPADCVFVDDDPELVAAALGLGYQALTISRGPTPPRDVPWINSLEELLPTGTTPGP
jgi:putative hydrolase of the HAD superfamily